MKRLLRKLIGDTSECEETGALVSDYADRKLDAGDQERVEEHLGACPRCPNILARLQLGPCSPWRG